MLESNTFRIMMGVLAIISASAFIVFAFNNFGTIMQLIDIIITQRAKPY